MANTDEPKVETGARSVARAVSHIHWVHDAARFFKFLSPGLKLEKPNPEQTQEPTGPEDPLVVEAKAARIDDHTMDQFRAALKQAKDPRGNFGATKNRFGLLSEQFFDEIRHQFPSASNIFDEADAGRKNLVARILVRRSLTFIVFALFIAIARGAAVSHLPVAKLPWIDFWAVSLFDNLTYLASAQVAWLCRMLPVTPYVPTLTSLALLGVLAVFLRWVIRLRFRIVSDQEWKDLAYNLEHKYKDIQHDITRYCGDINTREGTPDWPGRARILTILVMWNARLSEYSDRYTTITLWKIRQMFRDIERIFVAAKVVLLGLLVWSLDLTETFQPHGNFLLWFLLVVGLVGPIGFFLFDRRPNDHFDKLLEPLRKEQQQHEHYFLQLGRAIKSLVISVEKNEIGGK